MNHSSYHSTDAPPRRIHRLLVTLGVAVTVLLAPFTAAAPAFAHDQLVGSDPSAGASLPVAPSALTLRFSDSILTIGAVIQLENADGTIIPTPDAVPHGSVITVDLPTVPAPGDYSVRWRVVSADGHPITGEIPFAIGTGDAPPGASALPSPGAAVSASPSPAVVAGSTAEPDSSTKREPEASVSGLSGIVAALLALAGALLLGGMLVLIRGRRRTPSATEVAEASTPPESRHESAPRIGADTSPVNAPSSPPTSPDSAGEGISRRAVLGTALVSAGSAMALGVGTVATASALKPAPAKPTPEGSSGIDFHGVHQAGIETPQQQHVNLIALDLATVEVTKIESLLRDLTATARALSLGNEPPEKPGRPAELSTHTGYATGLGPARLTVTIGFGPGMFDLPALANRRPAQLTPLPEFAGDALDQRWSGGDILLQICADDAQVVSHAARSLRARIPGLATIRWTHNGFLGVPSGGGTPRNIFGQKDGTANPRPGSAERRDALWIGDRSEPVWAAGGTYLVFRKIRMKTATWDLTGRPEQDQIIGRYRDSGAPLTGTREFDAPDLAATHADGAPVIAEDAHVRRVHGIAMLRRGYNYDYGQMTAQAGGHPDPSAAAAASAPAASAPAEDGHEHAHGGHDLIDSGLLFCAYGNDPAGQFIRAQTAMAERDRLGKFIQATGSAIFLMPPGCGPTGFIGEGLLR